MGNAVRNNNNNSRFQDISGTVQLAAADGDTVLVTNPNANYSIFIQKIIVNVTTDAAQSASFEDTATTPIKIANLVSNPGLGAQEFDFGPQGRKLTEGKNFNLNVSAAGLAMGINWFGYMRPTAVSRAASAL